MHLWSPDNLAPACPFSPHRPQNLTFNQESPFICLCFAISYAALLSGSKRRYRFIDGTRTSYAKVGLPCRSQQPPAYHAFEFSSDNDPERIGCDPEWVSDDTEWIYNDPWRIDDVFRRIWAPIDTSQLLLEPPSVFKYPNPSSLLARRLIILTTSSGLAESVARRFT